MMVGDPGFPGTMNELGLLAGPVPIDVVAVTVKVYAVPFVRFLNNTGDTVSLTVLPPGEDVTVYPVMAEPPLLAGALNETSADVFPGDADTPVGAPGRFE